MTVLLMMMTVGGVIAAGVVLVVSLFTRNAWLAKFTLGAVVVWFAFYATMLVTFSEMSQEKTLAVNEPKEFCGFYLDCHLHTEVTGVRTAQKIGAYEAKGLYYIVDVRVFSDARNPSVALRLLQPKAIVTDENGAVYTRVESAEQALPSAAADLGEEIRSSQTILKEIVFDLPVGAADPRLDISEGYGIDKVLEALIVGDEDSIMHKRTYFKLQEQTAALGVK